MGTDLRSVSVDEAISLSDIVGSSIYTGLVYVIEVNDRGIRISNTLRGGGGGTRFIRYPKVEG